jgi:hypothetical protein
MSEKYNLRIPKMMPDKTVFELAAQAAKELSFGTDKTALFVSFMAIRFPHEHDLTFVRVWALRFNNPRPSPLGDMDEVSREVYKALILLQADVAIGKCPVNPYEEPLLEGLAKAGVENKQERSEFVKRVARKMGVE